MMKKDKLSKEEKIWILYDVGNSAFTLLATAIIPLYYKKLTAQAGIGAADSTAYYSYSISIATVIVALLGPFLGAMGDQKGYKKGFFAFFMLLGVLACAALSIPKSWLLFLIVFVIAKVGFSASLVFYDSMLVDITTDERMDEVSSQGYAWGYIGSCIPFVASLLLILKSDVFGLTTTGAMTISFLMNALWWGVVTIPLLRQYRQVYFAESYGNHWTDGLKRLKNLFGELKENKCVLLFLLAFFFYIDGVYTIIEMATTYGKDVGLHDTGMLLALLLTQVVAFPCSIIFGKLSKKIPVNQLICICVAAYFGVTVYALQLNTIGEFWFMACVVGVFQGAIQALSRSYYAKIIPKDKSGEYFGIYDIFGKGASFMGTLLMGITTQLFETSKAGVLAISILLILGFGVFLIQNKVQRKSQRGIKD